MLSATYRPILWMAKEEVWDLPVLRWFATQSGAFPVQRGSFDRNAIRTAIDTIQEGLLVGMYPEGTRSTTGGLKEPFPGVSLAAVRSGSPVIPCVIVGSEDLPLNGVKQRAGRHRYPRVEVWFGPAFVLNPRAADGKRFSMAELTEAMVLELARLMPPSMRGIYADYDFSVPHPAVQRDDVVFPGA